MKELSVISIKGELCDLNTYINKERSNRFSAAKIKKDMTEKCQKAMVNIPKNYYNKIYLTFNWCCVNKKKDPDNIAFAKKFILDAMVKSHIIPNDGWNNIIGFKDDFFIVDKPSVEIIIEEKENIDN